MLTKLLTKTDWALYRLGPESVPVMISVKWRALAPRERVYSGFRRASLEESADVVTGRGPRQVAEAATGLEPNRLFGVYDWRKRASSR